MRIEIRDDVGNGPTALRDVFIAACDNLDEIAETLEGRELTELRIDVLQGIEAVVQALWELKCIV